LYQQQILSQEKKITQTLGLVSGCNVQGVNFIKDMFASIANTFGGKSKSYAKEGERTKREAIDDMVENAKKLGADNIVSILVDMEVIPQKKGTLFMVNVTGTAVKSEDVDLELSFD